MTSRSNWRGRLLVDLSTGNISVDKSGQGTSDTFISLSYDPTAANQKQHEESRLSSPSVMETFRELEPPPDLSAPEPMENVNMSIRTPEPFAKEPVYYGDITMPMFEHIATEPIEYYDENIPATSDPSADIILHHHSELTAQPLPITSADLETPVCNETSCLDEVTGVFINKSTGAGHFLLDEKTGELTEIDAERDKNSDEFDLNEILEKRKNRNFNQKQRVTGKPYTGRKMEKSVEDNKQTLSFIAKHKREMKTKACSHSGIEAKSARTFLCGAISEERREATFRYYWSLDTWDAKKAYLKNLVRLRPIKRRRKSTQRTANLVKEQGFDCFFPNENNELIRVCKNFLLRTLVMTNDTLSTWIKHLHESRSDSSHVENSQPRTSKSASVREWLELLPKVPSHYCRASTSRIYVEDSFRSKTHMLKVYKKWCSENEKEAAKRKLFCLVLKAEKISIFKPRKDQCDTCTAFKEGNLTQEEYETHKAKKEEAYKAKTNAQALCSPEVLVVTMDVQSVLLSPKLQVSVQYYKQKLQIHNYTLYCSNDKDVHLYVWHEGDGGVTANEFVTCVIDFLNLKLGEGYKKVILISDGCCYQNRNKVLSSALLSLSVDKCIEIEQIILEKGHTMMQVDSVHSTLEYLFKPPIYSPNDYINLMNQARLTKPYVVHHLEYGFFKNFERTCQLDSIRPGKKTGDPVVTDVRGLLYKDGDIFFKLRHPDEWKILPQRRLRVNSSLNALYSTPRKIEKSKYESLQTLKSYMHRDYHYFYDNLKHN